MIAGKLLRLVPIVLLVSLGSFLLLELVPGDPALAVLGETATPERVAEVRAELGLDRPLAERYGEWLGGVVTGDFGRSVVPPVQDVSTMIAARLPVTLEIALLAMLMSLAMAVPFGLWTAHRAGAPLDTAVGGAAFAAISMPSFLSALVLVFFLIFNRGSVRLLVLVLGLALAAGVAVRAVRSARRDGGWERSHRLALVGAAVAAGVAVLLAVALPVFPRQGFVRITGGGLIENLRSAFLPALTLALVEGAVFLRVLRNDLVGTLQEDFVLAARAKGMSTPHVLVRDALRPSSFSLVTVAGVTLGRLLGGTVIVETVFRVPGMGSMLVDAIQTKDFPVVQASVLVLALLFVLINTAVDLSYAYLDPRIRRGGR
ncbi:MAG TPA: ABC transporter permease [Acidimicrobiales bacterium]